MNRIWGPLAALALLWPDRAAGPLDGIPLDRPAEAMLIGVVFPILWFVHPRFLTTRFARIGILALVLLRITSSAALTQQGWCVRFDPSQPYVAGQTGAPHAWDLRADWRAADPACSAIMTRSYGSLEAFPAWFFNLPPASESWPGPADRPPGATTRLTLRGFVTPRERGTLRIETTRDMSAVWSVDGGEAVAEAILDPGPHLIALDATLTGETWRLIPTWNGAAIWSQLTTVRRPSTLDRTIGGAIGPLAAAVAGALLVGWLIAALGRIADASLIAWATAASAVLYLLVATDHVREARIAIAMLAAAAAVPVRASSRHLRGAFVAIGIPWLVFVAACAVTAVGRFVLYEVGHDYWMYQRFAYRIVMQGHWIEGGTATFWFQPFYRWIAGFLHIVFGDSSAGEWLFDGAALSAIALFSFRVARPRVGWRGGVIAAVLPLAIFILGTPQYLIGRGLGEISSAGLLAAAALLAMRSRHGRLAPALAAGALATLAFYTRFNNLPMALGVAVFAWNSRRKQPAMAIVAAIAAGTLLLAWRNWYFTGAFNPFAGTQRQLLAIWQPGMPFAEGIRRTVDSVLMVLTVNDPPHVDIFALPVLAGAALAVAATALRPLRRIVPLRASLFFLCGIASAFVARGSAYPGRFSLHVLGVTSALTVSFAGAFLSLARPHRASMAADAPLISRYLRSALAVVPVWLTCAVIVFGAPSIMKLIVAAAFVTAAVSPYHALLGTAVVVPLAHVIGAAAGLGTYRLAEAVLVAFLAGWLLHGGQPRTGPRTPAWAGWALALCVVASIAGDFWRMAHHGLMGDTVGWLVYGYYLFEHYSGIVDGARILEGVALAVAVVSIFRARPGLATQLPAAIGLAAAVAGVATVLLWYGIAPRPILEQHMLNRYRVTAMAADVNAAGSFFVLVLCLALGMAGRAVRRTRLQWLVVAALCMFGAWLAGSRSAGGAALLALGGAITWPLVERRRARSKVLIISAVALIVAATAAWQVRELAADPDYRGADFRRAFTITSARMIAARPWSGVGVGQYAFVSPLFFSPALAFTYGSENAHNYFLQIAAELGVFGCAAFLAWLGIAIAGACRAAAVTPRDARLVGLLAAVAAFLVTCATGHPLLVTEVAFPFWALFGLLIGLSESALIGIARGRGPIGWPSGRLAAAAAAGAAAVLLIQIAGASAALRPSDRIEITGLYGWEKGTDGKRFRWSEAYASVFVPADATRVYIPVRAAGAPTGVAPITVETRTTGRPGAHIEVGEGWAEINVPLPDVPPHLSFKRINLRVDRTWQPALYQPGSADLRHVGVQVGEPLVFDER